MSKSSSDETLSTSESPSYASMYSGDQTNCSWQRIVLAPFGIMFYALAYVPFCWALLLQSSVTRSPVLPEQAVTQATAATPSTAAAAAAAALAALAALTALTAAADLA